MNLQDTIINEFQVQAVCTRGNERREEGCAEKIGRFIEESQPRGKNFSSSEKEKWPYLTFRAIINLRNLRSRRGETP